MKAVLLFAALVLTCLGQDRSTMEKHLVEQEGWRNHPYVDSLGRPHIGVGHLLVPETYGRGSFFMTDDAVLILFNQDLDRAIDGARRYTLDWDEHPEVVQEVLVYICFNIGANGYKRFIKMRRAVGERDYHAAAIELRKSLYYRQLPKRVEAYARVLEGQ